MNEEAEMREYHPSYIINTLQDVDADFLKVDYCVNLNKK